MPAPFDMHQMLSFEFGDVIGAPGADSDSVDCYLPERDYGESGRFSFTLTEASGGVLTEVENQDARSRGFRLDRARLAARLLPGAANHLALEADAQCCRGSPIVAFATSKPS